MKLIVGLGNPESEYPKTRHNIGKDVLNAFVLKQDVNWSSESKLECDIAKIAGGVLAKPHLYMNELGRAVRKSVDYYDVKLGDILIIYDDLDLVVGEYKLNHNKGSRIHNGVISVLGALGVKDGSDGPWHMRVGVREEEILGSVQKSGRDPAKYVLSQFGVSDRGKISQLIAEALVPKLSEFLSTEN